MLEGGCAIGNGGCHQFCFSVPASSGSGTEPECACSTGILMNPETNNCPIGTIHTCESTTSTEEFVAKYG